MELPRLEPIYQKYRDQGLSIIAVEHSRNREGAKKWLAQNPLSYPCLENGEGDAEMVYEFFQVSGFPTSYILDAQGRVLYKHFGYSEGDEVKMEEEIKRLMEG